MLDITIIFNWVGEVFTSYGYLIIVLGTFLESVVLISLAAPGLVIVLLAGYYAAKGVVWLPFVILLSLAGLMIGDNISYLLGRSVWAHYSDRYRFGRKINQISKSMVNRTIWFLPFYHFSGYGRAFVPLAAGAFKMPFARWFKYDIIGAVIWCVSFSLLGYLAGYYGTSIQGEFAKSNIIEWIFTAVFVGWVVAVGLTLRKLVRDMHGNENAVRHK
jgi:membrane-associated protein